MRCFGLHHCFGYSAFLVVVDGAN
jgi:hypothetical protein